MKGELLLKKCNKCGALVKVLKDCECDGCGIKCCDEEMKVLKPNSVDASVEKHLPTYEISGDEIAVKVNHVMEEEHFIEWVCFVSDSGEFVKKFNPGDACEVRFQYIPGSVIYSYCNKHGLWKKDVV